MKNQSSGRSGGSSKIQTMVDPSSKKISGKGSAAGSSKGKSGASAGVAGHGGATGMMVPASVKGGHLTASK
jgi:hypothetical protein